MNVQANSKWLKLGIVGKAHGLRGFFFVSGRDEPIPETVTFIRLGAAPDALQDIKIEVRQWQAGRPVIKCEQILDRTAAEKLRGSLVWCTADQVIVDDASEYLLNDLYGRQVFDSEDQLLGVVEEAFESPVKGVNLIIFDERKNADIEIPMVADYVNMEFKRGEKSLKLIVKADTFDEIWNERRPKK